MCVNEREAMAGGGEDGGFSPLGISPRKDLRWRSDRRQFPPARGEVTAMVPAQHSRAWGPGGGGGEGERGQGCPRGGGEKDGGSAWTPGGFWERERKGTGEE